MQPSTHFDWGHVMTPLRWVVRALGVVVAVATFLVLSVTLTYGQPPNVLVYVLEGIAGAGLLLAIAWTGIGEVVGGLAIVAADAVFIAYYPWMVAVAAPMALIGLMVIAIGWFALAQRRRPTAHTPA